MMKILEMDQFRSSERSEQRYPKTCSLDLRRHWDLLYERIGEDDQRISGSGNNCSVALYDFAVGWRQPLQLKPPL